MESLMQPSRVDWDVVDEELDRVPDEFKDPRFDSLRHVLDILSAVDAEAALQELKAQQERVEQMVDDVVQGYHGGFNKSTHNYSQILHLFTMAKDQVHKLRSQLEDAQRRLTSQSHSLEAQWKRSTTLGETVRLLRDINSCTDTPARVQQLQEDKKWTEAVALLLEGCTKLARSEYAGIGALKELKRELGARRGALLRALVAEMEAAVFEGLEAGRLHEPAEQDLYRLASAGSDMPRLASGASSTWGGTWQQPQSPQHANPRASMDERRPGTPLAQGLAGAASPGQEGHMGKEAEERCQELVAAVACIGGLAEAQAALRRHLPTQVSRVILRAMQHAKPLHGPRQPPASGSKGMALDPATVQTVVWLLDCVFSSCSQALQKLVRLLKLVAAARPPPPSAGLELLLASGAAAGQAAAPAGPPASGLAYVRREADHAWECMQKELQALLSDLLQPGAASDTSSFQPGADGTKLTFSFDVQVQGVSARALLQRESSLPRWEGGDQQALLRAALQGFNGSTYLTPHVYLPTKQFVELMLRSLGELDREAEAASSAWFGGGGGDRSEQRHSLRTFLAGFVDTVFLPTLALDCRSQFAPVLEDPEGMRERSKPQGGAAVASAANGQALLPAAGAAEVSVQQLLGWALLMPPFASRLVGVLEEVVGRVLEAFQARTGELLAGSAAQALAGDASLALQMAGEPAAPQAGEAAAFYVQRAGESIDHFVASILQTGWGSGGEQAEIAVLQRVLKERPVAASALLTAGGSSRVTHLAAAADSLEHLAGVIEGCISQAVAELPFSPQRSVQTPRVRPPGAEGGPLPPPPPGKRGGLPLDGLDHLVDRYRSLAGQSLRALRLEMLLLVVHHLSHLAQARFVCDAAEAQDVDECIGSLQRACARADEAASPFLPPSKRAYVFGGTAAAAARFVMWLLPELKAMNHAGLARICRMLAVLQPFLAALGSAGGLFRPEDARHLERARAYYAHLTYAAPALLSAAAARPTRFTPKEYMALLEVDFQGREVQDGHRAEMARVMLAAAKKSSRPSLSRP